MIGLLLQNELLFLSLIVFIGLLFVSLKTGLIIFLKSQDKKLKVIALFSMLGLTAYFVQGLFNNFLDDCKMAFLFWSSLSALAAIDSETFHKNKNEISQHPFQNKTPAS